MYELNSRRIIREARVKTRCFSLSTAELSFVWQSKLLNDRERLISYYIAAKTSFQPNLTCRLTQQEMADLASEGPGFIEATINRLANHGFLIRYGEPGLGTFYTLSLPREGLEFLMDTPKVCQCSCLFGRDQDASEPLLHACHLGRKE